MPNNTDHSTDNLLRTLESAASEPSSELLFVCISAAGERMSTIVKPGDQPQDLHVRQGVTEAPAAHEFTLHGTTLPDEERFRTLACQVAASHRIAETSDDPMTRLLKRLIPL